MPKEKCGCSDAPATGAAPSTHSPAQPEHVKEYAAHFVNPPADFVKEKAAIFQIERGTIDLRPPLYLCLTAGRWTRFHAQKDFAQASYHASDYLHYVTPTDLDHLKAIAGVPNAVHQREPGRYRHDCGKWRVEMHHLPPETTIHLNKLSPPQRDAVRDLSLNLLFGPVDPARASEPPYKAVIESMLTRAAKLPTFVGKNLYVCPDETVEFIGFAAVYFDNVVVHGNGRILLGAGTKLHAYQVKHA